MRSKETRLKKPPVYVKYAIIFICPYCSKHFKKRKSPCSLKKWAFFK